MSKKILIFIVLIGIGVGLTGCWNNSAKDLVKNTATETVKDSKENSLNPAKELTVTKKWLSLNNTYKIKTDTKESYQVSGKFVNFTGDVFTLKNSDGEVIGSEKQIKRWGLKMNRMAEIYNENDEIVGYIGEEVIKDLFNLGYKFHFYDSKGSEIGYTKQQVLSITNNNKIYNDDGSTAFEIKGKLFSLTASYTINVVDNSKISTEQAVFFTCILNEIIKAKED